MHPLHHPLRPLSFNFIRTNIVGNGQRFTTLLMPSVTVITVANISLCLCHSMEPSYRKRVFKIKRDHQEKSPTCLYLLYIYYLSVTLLYTMRYLIITTIKMNIVGVLICFLVFSKGQAKCSHNNRFIGTEARKRLLTKS